jgi:hypothetical protein
MDEKKKAKTFVEVRLIEAQPDAGGAMRATFDIQVAGDIILQRISLLFNRTSKRKQ